MWYAGRSQTPFGFRGGLDSRVLIVKNDFERWLSQTPFGFRGGLDSRKTRTAAVSLRWSQTPFGFWGGLDKPFDKTHAFLDLLVSNAFRLWGWVGYSRAITSVTRRSGSLKRLSALGVGWISERIITDLKRR